MKNFRNNSSPMTKSKLWQLLLQVLLHARDSQGSPSSNGSLRRGFPLPRRVPRLRHGQRWRLPWSGRTSDYNHAPSGWPNGKQVSFICPGFNPTTLRFPIFVVNLSHFVSWDNYTIGIKWSSLIVKNVEIVWFTEKKSLVGLTPALDKSS